MSVQIQPAGFRGVSEGQQLQPSQKGEVLYRQCVRRHNLKAVKISQRGDLLMLWETAEHGSIGMVSALVHHILTEKTLKKPWKSPGKPLEKPYKPQKNSGKPWKTSGQILEKPLEDHRKKKTWKSPWINLFIHTLLAIIAAGAWFFLRTRISAHRFSRVCLDLINSLLT